MSTVGSEEMESARLYSLLHQGSKGDETFYLNACSDAESVLELGCGFGRLLGPLAEAGKSVTGIDSGAAMLKLAEKNFSVLPSEAVSRIRLLQADMTDFHTGGKYDRVLIPFNGLYCLSSDREVEACFESARAHLNPGGRLLFDVYRVDPADEPDPDEEQDDTLEFLTTIFDGDREIDVREKDIWNPARSTIEVTYLFTCRGSHPARQLRQTLIHRYMAPETIIRLLNRAGLQVAAEYGGFGKEKPDRDSVHMVVEAC
jgi:SAM-dependent methyltransferase